ncbi:KUP system potassium uptake protein [Roseiarcus fermentans]|uniref:Probable potassium transport system protein Kup n=1 Tax=Roseiarcus fermentans TaxID=1473586 RepID=A0A366FTQ1_9HYPH|nr:potassium transporter Kup [Roseiarcus fermentans]RBP17526.1 KUP system potassium uptake protein [Roseiarcus fermentans]
MSENVSKDSPALSPPVAEPAAHGHSGGQFWILALGSIGVVFGDIGTSPLYALQTALSQFKGAGLTARDVIGVVSLIIWALLIVVTAKYVVFLMQADNKGEGGILSLKALAQRALGQRTTVAFLLGAAGAALFSGDAMITPAISVLSALEGLKQVDADLAPYILPATVVILVLLFAAQSRGTAGVAAFFGPIMVVFFTVNAALGIIQITAAWQILEALSPIPGLGFIVAHGAMGFVVLGSVFLAVTGAEALYADMGHFGRRPIQVAWLFLVLPALVCNYLGQGALILNDPKAVENPFYLMAPSWGLMPLILLATAATVIASQAVITGAFSLASQAIQLGLLPRLEIVHTSSTQEGQIFIPRVNRVILLGVLALVLLFRSSDNLANAYGIAVAGTMVTTTALAFFVVWKLWRWPLWGALALVCGFLSIDIGFFIANLYKVLDGGWVPLMLGGAMFVLMWTWSRGSKILNAKSHRDSIPMADLIKMLQKSKPVRVPGTAVFLTNDPTSAPSSLMHNLKHNKVLHERVVLLNVRTETTPRVADANRFEITPLSSDFTLVTLHFGFMEQPHIPRALAAMRKAGLKFDIMTTSFFLGRRTLKAAPNSGMPQWQDKLFIAMSKQAASAPDFFNLPSDRVVELGAQMKV